MDLEGIRRTLAELVTVEQAAGLAACHGATVRRAFDAGAIEGVRSPALGRLILRESALRWASDRNEGRRRAA